MELNDTQIEVFVAKVLHLGQGKRKEYLNQADTLIKRLEKKIEEDSSFNVVGFRKTGSLVKGTVLKPRGDYGVDADIAVFLDLSEAERQDVGKLHQIVVDLLVAAYPNKSREDFEVQPRTLGIHFRESGLDVDLVPVIPIKSEPGYGWQPSSKADAPVKTNIAKQLEFIRNRRKADPRFRTIARLVKNWRNHLELDRFRSFTIELIVAHLYDRHGAARSLESGLERFFRYVAQSELLERIAFPELGKISQFPNDPVVILDPVNAQNNVTARLSDSERAEIVSAAKIAWETLQFANWKDCKGETLDLWKEVMGRSFVIEEA